VIFNATKIKYHTNFRFYVNLKLKLSEKLKKFTTRKSDGLKRSGNKIYAKQQEK